MWGEQYQGISEENITESTSAVFITNFSRATPKPSPATVPISVSSSGGGKFRDLVSSLSLIIVVIIVSAGALAFVVLFNLSNININERVHELATIKVLGFYDGEVAAYVYREFSLVEPSIFNNIMLLLKALSNPAFS